MHLSDKNQKNTKEYHIGAADLPLACPHPGMDAWSAHPKVYLPIEKGKSVSCKYCGSVYHYSK